jgi:hypothetical protein
MQKRLKVHNQQIDHKARKFTFEFENLLGLTSIAFSLRERPDSSGEELL